MNLFFIMNKYFLKYFYFYLFILNYKIFEYLNDNILFIFNISKI